MLKKKVCLLLSIVLLLAISGFSLKEVSASSLKDVPQKYSKEISFLVENEIIFGYPGSVFYPDRPVTRAEAAAMIGRSVNLEGAKRKTSFDDVSSSSYASGFIQSAYEKGIISGYKDGSYKPDRHITRGEMAILISRAFKLSSVSGIYYNDLPSSGTIYQAVNLVSTAGIAAGYPDGTYQPNKSITRAEFALLIARSINPDFKVVSKPQPIGERVVSTTVLNVRNGPGTEFGKVGQLLNGSKITIYQVIGDWVFMSYGKMEGFVHSHYISEAGLKVVAIDPGHGGTDPGASGNGVVEKELNLDVSLRTKKYLEREGIQVVMTRETDKYVTLSGRVDYAVDKGADTFVSIHGNSYGTSLARGTETFYSSAGLNPRAEASRQLSIFIQKRLVAAMGTTDRGVRDGVFQVIKSNPLPSSLVELGFISNSGDAAKLRSDQYREAAAKAIALGIKDYYNWLESK
ncbi:N-acetylmuramoyl-L-alanine amidase [Rossellomorea vietnamensis]|nr:N-acetylmuramoyl-L-alanine amidase [Rossellomorea vietnamensis]